MGNVGARRRNGGDRGYALRTYDRFRRIVKFPMVSGARAMTMYGRQHRMNVGTIIEDPMINVRQVSFLKASDNKRLMRPGRKLGEMEEYFFRC